MTISKNISRFICIGLGAAALVACGDSGNNVTDGGSDSASSGDSTGTTNDPSNTTPATSETTPTSAPTEGSGGMTGMDTGTDTTATGTDTGTDTDPGTDTSMVDPVCGNNILEGKEACDDGNVVGGDGCEADCTLLPVCGNGMVEMGEACDDNNTMDGDECSADCQTVTTPVVCGDGKQEGDEQCDDGNPDPGDGCEADCTITPPECGNGKVEMGEACDDGNDVNGGKDDFCKNDCTIFMPPACEAPADYKICDSGINLADKADKTNAHKAMGICNDLPDNSVQISNFSFNSNNNAAWQVAKGFGTYKFDDDMDPNTPDELYYSPREGDTFLMVSTGVIKAPNPQGIVIENNNSQVGNGNNTNDDGNALPAPFQVAVGSNNGAGGTPFQDCDGVTFKDCSDTLQAQWTKGGNDPNDKLWFTFKTKVPKGTFGYTFDFVFCSSEWPTWVNTGFNDLLIAYQVDPAADDPNADPVVDPYSGNVTFIPDPNNNMKGLPLTITALDPYFKGPGFTGNEAPLAGTGFETHACTEWFSAKGGVQPGSDVTIGFFIADMSDSILATMAILDNFRWDCKGCVPSEVDDCGVQEPQ
jgi:cysteine-rich repeat protein